MPGVELQFDFASLNEPRLASWVLRLVQAASPNPPGDTRAAAECAASILREAAPEADVELFEAAPGFWNLTALVRGNGPGKRVVLNGHLDTYPVGDPTGWQHDPAGEVVGERLYGRGAADMKGGIVASIVALAALARRRAEWPGEVVLSLAGDEESMGPLGTKWLLDKLPYASGDAVLIADAGSPQVLRFGEKGFVWIEIEAEGRPAHGAHVHLGTNALDRLRAALDAVQVLKTLPVATPPEVAAAIAASQPISEPLSGAGEAETLQALTINLGFLHGGSSANLVPPYASAGLDIRIPVGLTADAVLAALHQALDGLPGITWKVLRNFAPNMTAPDSALVRACTAAAERVTGKPVAVNMRVGGSDSRWFRMAGMPTVVYGPTPHNMGGVDEYVLLPELEQVARVHALTAITLLKASA